ncbi:hypothetical protein Bint_0265 [Brachyspira intermedia PWS/A]|uniref:Uncharacterized protein n=1 Tax=Brachyspira intermedia (strain ATCC 51140 / PWS/A) TaxID=1045858 RepID=G0EHT7_BRAIP|nr:hypothetical protein [Brachyspira intermedia]AEM20900.1 hypothetical protein Bint_0265 [Brachyspira intermedia PWS/A]
MLSALKNFQVVLYLASNPLTVYSLSTGIGEVELLAFLPQLIINRNSENVKM